MARSPSYLRNGRVGTNRGLSGNDGDNFGDESEEVAVQVRDLRAAGRKTAAGREPTLEREGFVLKRFYEEFVGQERGDEGKGTVNVGTPFFPRSILRRAAFLGGRRNILRVIIGTLTLNILGLHVTMLNTYGGLMQLCYAKPLTRHHVLTFPQ